MINAKSCLLGCLVWFAATIFFPPWAAVASAQEAFKTPQAAADALGNAAKAGDRDAILAVLGKKASDIISSGDPVADAATLKQFNTAYDAKNRVVQEDAKATLVIGEEDFPFPIPLRRENGTWQFDINSGRQEILFRRIGRNELDAIQTCLAYVDAQNEYSEADRTGAGSNIYAQRVISHPGTKDGLYWPDAEGKDPSPLGELVANATTEGYHAGTEPAPFHGYYYKILTRQGPSAAGGALDYVVRGKMIGGFALVAYPAEYENSGLMTFIVNHGGTVYQKNLGPRTRQIAERMVAFEPDDTWQAVPANNASQ